MVKGMFVWAAGEGSRGMGGPLMRTPPLPIGRPEPGPSAGPAAGSGPGAPQDPAAGKGHPSRGRSPPTSLAPPLGGARPAALAADDSLPTIAQDSPPGPFSAWAGPDLTVCAFPGVPGPATVATAELCTTPPARSAPQPGGLYQILVKKTAPPAGDAAGGTGPVEVCELGGAGTSRPPSYHRVRLFGVVGPLLRHQHSQHTTGYGPCQGSAGRIVGHFDGTRCWVIGPLCRADPTGPPFLHPLPGGRAEVKGGRSPVGRSSGPLTADPAVWLHPPAATQQGSRAYQGRSSTQAGPAPTPTTPGAETDQGGRQRPPHQRPGEGAQAAAHAGGGRPDRGRPGGPGAGRTGRGGRAEAGRAAPSQGGPGGRRPAATTNRPGDRVPGEPGPPGTGPADAAAAAPGGLAAPPGRAGTPRR